MKLHLLGLVCFLSLSLHGMEMEELENKYYKHALSKAKKKRIKKRERKHQKEPEVEIDLSGISSSTRCINLLTCGLCACGCVIVVGEVLLLIYTGER